MAYAQITHTVELKQQQATKAGVQAILALEYFLLKQHGLLFDFEQMMMSCGFWWP